VTINESRFSTKARLTGLRFLVRDGYFPEERCKNGASSKASVGSAGDRSFPLRLHRLYLLPMIKQNLLAGFTDFRPILLEAGENRQVSF
jgi:hypothetical protein